MATLMDISRRVSLNPATVSKILSGQPGYSEETRLRVQEAARDLNYRPNLTARGLRGNKSYLIGVMDDKVNTQLLAALLDGIQSATAVRRYAPIVFVHKNGEVQDQNVALCLDRHIDGLLVTVHVQRDENIHVGALADLVERGFPMIEMHGTCLPGVPSVRFDYEAGGRMALRHLLELGHRRIAIFPHEQRGLLKPSNLFWYRQEFVEGCLAEIAAAGGEPFVTEPVSMEPQNDLVWKSTAQQVVQQILGQRHPPTAIVCMGTDEAVSVMYALQNAGISVPEQISLIAHSPYGIETFLARPVTEVKHSSQEAGTQAVNSLFERMEGKMVANALIGPELIVGRTTAPPPAGG